MTGCDGTLQKETLGFGEGNDVELRHGEALLGRMMVDVREPMVRCSGMHLLTYCYTVICEATCLL